MLWGHGNATAVAIAGNASKSGLQLEEEYGRMLLDGLSAYFLIWYLPVVIMIGTLGAVFCMLFIFMSKMFPKIIQVWLMSICFGDFMILYWDVLRLFLKLAFDYDYIDQGVVICKLQMYFSSFFFHWSAYNQAAMSIQRLVFIASPLRSRTILNTRRVFAIWGFMTALLTFPNITYLLYWHLGVRSDCEPTDKWFYYVTTLVHLVVWGIIPLVSMVISTGCISYRLIRYRQGNFKSKYSANGVPKPTVIGGRRHGSDQGAHVTRLLVSMNLFYLFTTFPLLIYMMYLNFWLENKVGISIAKSMHKFYYYLFRSICFLNASLNWVFYCAAGKIFRQRALQIMYRVFCPAKNHFRGGGPIASHARSTAAPQTGAIHCHRRLGGTGGVSAAVCLTTAIVTDLTVPILDGDRGCGSGGSSGGYGSGCSGYQGRRHHLVVRPERLDFDAGDELDDEEVAV